MLVARKGAVTCVSIRLKTAFEVATQVRAVEDSIEAALAVDHESRELARGLLPEIAVKAS